MGPFDLISIIYANIQNLLRYFVAPCLNITFMPSFIKIRLNMTEKKQFKYTDGQMTTGWPVIPPAALTFGHSIAKNSSRIVTNK